MLTPQTRNRTLARAAERLSRPALSDITPAWNFLNVGWALARLRAEFSRVQDGLKSILRDVFSRRGNTSVAGLPRRHSRHMNWRHRWLPGFLTWVGVAATSAPGSAGTISLTDLNSQLTIDLSAAGVSHWDIDSSSYPDPSLLRYQVGAPAGPSALAIPKQPGPQRRRQRARPTRGDPVSRQSRHQRLSLAPHRDLHAGWRRTRFGVFVAHRTTPRHQRRHDGGRPFLAPIQQPHTQQRGGYSPVSVALDHSPGIGDGDGVLGDHGTAYGLRSRLGPGALDCMESNPSLALTGAMGPVSGNTASAMEWDMPLGAGQSYNVVQQYSIAPVPEPSIASMLAAAAFGAAARFRRRAQRAASTLAHLKRCPRYGIPGCDSRTRG